MLIALLTMSTTKIKRPAKAKAPMAQVNARVPTTVLARLESRAAAMSVKTGITITVGAIVRSILEEYA